MGKEARTEVQQRPRGNRRVNIGRDTLATQYKGIVEQHKEIWKKLFHITGKNSKRPREKETQHNVDWDYRNIGRQVAEDRYPRLDFQGMEHNGSRHEEELFLGNER